MHAWVFSNWLDTHSLARSCFPPPPPPLLARSVTVVVVCSTCVFALGELSSWSSPGAASASSCATPPTFDPRNLAENSPPRPGIRMQQLVAVGPISPPDKSPTTASERGGLSRGPSRAGAFPMLLQGGAKLLKKGCQLANWQYCVT